MKYLKLTMVLATVTLAAVSCGPRETTQNVEPKEEAPKMLVLFYSQTSNTKVVADLIASQLDAYIDEIVPVQPYDGDFQATFPLAFNLSHHQDLF